MLHCVCLVCTSLHCILLGSSGYTPVSSACARVMVICITCMMCAVSVVCLCVVCGGEGEGRGGWGWGARMCVPKMLPPKQSCSDYVLRRPKIVLERRRRSNPFEYIHAALRTMKLSLTAGGGGGFEPATSGRFRAAVLVEGCPNAGSAHFNLCLQSPAPPPPLQYLQSRYALNSHPQNRPSRPKLSHHKMRVPAWADFPFLRVRKMAR